MENYVLCNNIEYSPIDVQIAKDFQNKIFADESCNNVRNILYAIFEDEQSYIEKFLQNKVCLEYQQTGGASGERLIDVWKSLSEEIKYTNRFLINKSINLKLLEKVLERHIKIIKKDSTFYRARISDKNGLKSEEMWNPPNKKASAGRANPKGISYLYLCMDEETTLYEVRALLYDFVTIAKFKNNVQIKIINLNETEIYDPLQLSEVQELSGFLQHLPFIKELSDELSKPLRRFDDELDYIPTQFLCEFIKSLGYDGIEYKSSLHKKGTNFAIFNPNKFEVLNNPLVKEITDIKYTYSSVEKNKC